MKKFLKLKISSPAPELPPASVESTILATAALKARRIRQRQTMWKIIPAAGLISTAAAAAVVAFLPDTGSMPIQSAVQNVPSAAIPRVAVNITTPPPQKVEIALPGHTAQVQNTDFLALGDTTVLEQENYNLAVMSDMSFDMDNFSM